MIEILVKSLMLLSVVFDGIYFSVYGLNFNFERIFLTLLSVPIFFLIVSPVIVRDRVPDNSFKGGWLIGLWCISLAISVLWTSNPFAHLNGFAISVAPAIVYFLFSGGTKNSIVLRTFGEPILWYLAGFGVAAYLIWALASPEWVTPFIDRNRIKLTLYEANIYGATLSYFLILHFPHFKRIWRHYILYALALAALFLSFSRTPYVGFVVGAYTYLVTSGYFKTPRATLSFAALSIAIVLLTVTFSDILQSIYATNLDRSDSYGTRIIQLNYAIDQFASHPVFGNGPLDFGLNSKQILSAIGSKAANDVWIWQMFVAVAHDSGLVGLALYLAFTIGLLRHGYRLARKKGSIEHAAYLSGFVALLIDSQTTTIHLTATFGVAAGLLGSGLAIRRRTAKSTP